MYGNAQRSVHAPFSAVLQAALHGRADERHVAVVLGTDGDIRVEQLFFRLFFEFFLIFSSTQVKSQEAYKHNL